MSTDGKKSLEKTATDTKHDEQLNFSRTHNHLTCLKTVAAFVLLCGACFSWKKGGHTFEYEIQLGSRKKKNGLKQNVLLKREKIIRNGKKSCGMSVCNGVS